ncbi:Synaptotagmin-like protein 1 [Bagarius yarrelli]|uniref:Synaptotagmin-like protein 1 n=1 Tax=Bagarius yarrelli TaxID=175774 RepID=A0A556TJZ7_BAGYA|nr:Synaptotagmin-like protein 1 [Bagarius yarrelli]
MIDVSYLTEEEQELILSVLKRDADLKDKEEQRIRMLQRTERDKCKLKYLTGEWFYETKLHRHRDKMNGSDIVQASMSRRKPVTIMELTQIWPGNSSYLKSESKDIFIPPELTGLIGEPSSYALDNRDDPYLVAECRSSAHPQSKLRQNPFNSRSVGLKSPGKTEGHLQTKVQSIPGTSHQVPSNQQPAQEMLLVSQKPSRAPQILADGKSEDPNPVRTAQKQAKVRPVSISKSLEDLATLSSTPESLSIAIIYPEQSKRLSASVPAFMHEKSNSKESDCLSVNSFYSERQRKHSTNTNTSASSDLASMSSVSGSVTNLHGTDYGHVEVRGSIRFAINYVNKLGELHIFIVQCRNLAVADPKRNRSDPYVKCYLLPDKLGKRKTSVKRKTFTPTYNEILRIATPCSPKHVNHKMDVCGAIRISLRFLLQSQTNTTAQSGELQVWVKECMNLQCRRGTIDPFVKCSILPDSQQKKRQKSRVVKRTANPVFNHSMVFDGLKPEDLRDTCVEITVWDHDRLSNHFIGGTRLNLGTDNHWISPDSPKSPMVNRKRGRSARKDVDAMFSSPSEECDRALNLQSEITVQQSSPESDSNDWELDELLASDFSWALEDEDLLSPFRDIGLQNLGLSADDEMDKGTDVSVSQSTGSTRRQRQPDLCGSAINKNALAARLNRLKKKEYLNGLEQRVGSLTSENRLLKQENSSLNKRVEELENETRYLRAVLANESMLAQLLSRLSGVNGMKFSTSLFQAPRENDHDYAMPRKKVKVEEKDTTGGICLHVDKDHVSVEFCTKCAESASTSLKM